MSKLNIFDDVDDKSLEAMRKAGNILPSLKPVLNRIYKGVKVIGFGKDKEGNDLVEPKAFDSKKYGTAYSMEIEYEEMTYSIVLPLSFRVQLINKMEMNGIDSWINLVGRSITFQKQLGNTKTMENVPLYSVQLND